MKWRSAYYDRGPVSYGTAPFTEPAVEQILYRFYDRFGILLYIGITGDAATRWKNHRKDKNWWPLVARIDLERHTTRDDVEAAEKTAIEAERPLCNITHNRKRMQPTDPQHFEDACWQCGSAGNPRGSHAAVEMNWTDDGLDTLHRCPQDHQWTCSWGAQFTAYPDCDCSWCRITTGRLS